MSEIRHRGPALDSIKKIPDNPFEWFDGIFVINLDRDLQRWIHFSQEMDKLGISGVVRVSGRYSSIGSWGCAVSHKEVLRLAGSRGLRNILVLEDDVSFIYDKARTYEVLKAALESVSRTGYGILYLGCTVKHGEPVPRRPKTNPYKLDITVFGGFAMAINLDGVKGLYEDVPDDVNSFTSEHRNDMLVIDHVPSKLKMLVVPCLATVNDSFISQTGVNTQSRDNIKKRREGSYIMSAYKLYGFDGSAVPASEEAAVVAATAGEDNPSVSVIMPAYRTAKYIEEALDSVYSQTYFRDNTYEVLVGVDSCPDTLIELERIRHKYPHLKVYITAENVGPFVVRNTLTNISTGDRIVFFDSDDIMYPDLVDRIVENGAPLVQYRVREFKDGDYHGSGIAHNWYAFGSIGLSRELWKRAGGFKAWRCAADKEFAERCLRFSTGGKLSAPGYFYRRSDNALTVAPESNFSSPMRRKYHEMMKIPASVLFEHPVTVECTRAWEPRTPVGLNIFSNCTGKPDLVPMLLKTYNSWVKTFGYPDSTTVYLDRNPVADTLPGVKKALTSEHFKVVITESLSDGYIRSLADAEFDFVFQLEHDWEFLPGRVKHSLDELTGAMLDGGVMHLRFNKRSNIVAKWDKKITGVKLGGIDFCITDQLSNNPHIINVRAYLDKAVNRLKVQPGSKGIEEVLSWRDLEGHIYGPIGYAQVIEHLDGRK